VFFFCSVVSLQRFFSLLLQVNGTHLLPNKNTQKDFGGKEKKDKKQILQAQEMSIQ
jgi:hypothetical protein